MKIAFNPSTVAALTTPPNNKDITFDLRGHSIFAQGVKFYGTDTNTWRDIKINNVSIGSHTLDLRNGSNTTLANTNGVVTINSTWRPVVDNLTSDSTTSSLSAKQGKVLKALIDGKSNSDHNHDGRYVKKSGDTMQGVLTIGTTNFGALTIKRNDDAYGASIQFRGKSSVYGYIGLNNDTKDKQFMRWSSDISRVYTILDTSSTYISNGKGVINGTTITQVDNATNSNKLTTARNIALGMDLRGSANFDGSGNITINANINACTIGGGDTNELPFKRIAHYETGDSWYDSAILLYISQGYINGSNGICKVEFRTDNLSSGSTSITATAAVKWLVRNGYGLDSLYAGCYATTGKAYIDIYLKTTGGYQGTVIRALQDSRGVINSNVQLINSYYYSDTNHKEAYNSIEAASTALYNRAYTKIVPGIDVGTVSYSNSTGFVRWENIADKPSAFYPADHTHTVFNNNLMIKGTNGMSNSAIIHLGIGDSDTGFRWISDGVCQIYANNIAIGQWTSGGMNWFKNPTVNGKKVWNVENDGPGSGLDADTLDGEHASSFVRAGYYASQDINQLDTYSFIRSVYSNVSSTSPKGNTGWYNVIQLVHGNGAGDGPSYIGQIALGMTTNTNDMFFRGRRTDPWKTVIHSDNIGNQTVANAYHLRINSANSWSTWNWAGQSGQPSWLWGSNDGTNMYIWNPSNFNVNTAQYLRSLGDQNCQTGRTQAYDGVYTYNTRDGYTGFPKVYSSVIGFGRGTAGTVEIAGGWCNSDLYWRSLRDCDDDWYPWRRVLDSSNYTEFINNYYWANVKISASSSTTTSPTFSNVYLGNSLYLNNGSLNSIYNGPNDSAKGVGGPLNNLVFSSWYGVSFTTSCEGMTYTNKNAVSINCRTGQLYAGEVQANGFRHTGYNNNDAVLLAGGGYKTLKDFIFINKYNYSYDTYYSLTFHKLSGICNNLVWVDGYVMGSIATIFDIDPSIVPYRYNDNLSVQTVYLMGEDGTITISATGTVTIRNLNDHKYRVGFFYTGKA